MNQDIFEGKWEEVKGQMKQAWGWMTDDDMKQIEGNHQEIYGKLQKHYGYGREEAEKAVTKFRNQFKQH
ncbi:CsbD family protein [Legionella feeleii]|uniref:Stress response protein n=1 Tax=Legionella feeleii TaxID=453 RepID=A0A0W0TXX5_9GAMM|nr:CsbD family protein [Legionella feeleii]KTD00626.1 stress response protein [Legionella feeleii]SPX59280.1 General stress response protein [Legionella feeleii]